MIAVPCRGLSSVEEQVLSLLGSALSQGLVSCLQTHTTPLPQTLCDVLSRWARGPLGLQAFTHAIYGSVSDGTESSPCHLLLHHMKFYLFLEALHTRGGNEVIVSIWTCCKAQTDSLALSSPNVAVANVYHWCGKGSHLCSTMPWLKSATSDLYCNLGHIQPP